MRRKKVELYEILANKVNDDDTSSIASSDFGADRLKTDRFIRQRTGREVVFSLDAAFVILIVFLALVGTAYVIGYRKGVVEEKASFARPQHVADSSLGSSLERVKETPLAQTGVIKIPGGKFTLRLLTSRNHGAAELAKLREERKKLLVNDVIGSNSLDVFVFDTSTNYLLTIGLFDSREDEVLNMLKKFFAESYLATSGAPVFRDTSVEIVNEAGKPLL